MRKIPHRTQQNFYFVAFITFIIPQVWISVKAYLRLPHAFLFCAKVPSDAPSGLFKLFLFRILIVIDFSIPFNFIFLNQQRKHAICTKVDTLSVSTPTAPLFRRSVQYSAALQLFTIFC